MDIGELLSLTITRGASDLHLVSDYPPTLRINGELKPMVTYPFLNSSLIEEMVKTCLNSAQKEILVNNREIDFSTVYQLSNGEKYRFRGNAYYQKGTTAASFRLIPAKIKTISELNLPEIFNKFLASSCKSLISFPKSKNNL